MNLSKEWEGFLKEEFEKDYFKDLIKFVDEEYRTQTVFPPVDEIFSAFDFCDLDNLKVVILGQDPYHGYGQANGLCFSVKDGVKIPPSLRNIFKELNAEFGVEAPLSGDLTHWAKQGVLMINATMTVREKQPGSHQKKGWEMFTDSVIERIAENKKDVVFVLWGAFAQKKTTLIDSNKHYVLESAHPSPFSAHRGFLGNNHFKLINKFLLSKGKGEIKW
ncbi:MAG: uracil-DNA glycosylase [Flavobacteriales bacterium]|nr:uracil-DNA glycosylase [Flavobacteriales bacterium]